MFHKILLIVIIFPKSRVLSLFFSSNNKQMYRWKALPNVSVRKIATFKDPLSSKKIQSNINTFTLQYGMHLHRGPFLFTSSLKKRTLNGTTFTRFFSTEAQ